MGGDPVTMRDVHGNAYDVPADQVQDALGRGFRVEGTDEHVGRVTKEADQAYYGTPVAKVVAGGAAVFRGATGGLSDVGLRALYGDEGRRDLEALRDINPGVSLVGDLAGTVISPIGRVGSAISKVGEGASIATKLVRGGAAGVVEGGLYGFGSGVSDLALDDKPITVERIGSVLSSKMLHGGAIGGVAGTIGKVAEIGLQKGRQALDEVVAGTTARNAVDDLAQLDAKGLRAAREAEVDAIKAGHKKEIEALEATRVTERASIADDIGALRREVKDNKHFLTTDGVKLAEVEGMASVRELGKLGRDAELGLARVLNNPKGLAQNPMKALDALQRQENAMVKLLERGDELRGVFAADKTGQRLAALESIPGALEKNRALQERIMGVSQPHAPVPATSPRLEAIEAARDALMAGGSKGFVEKLPEKLLQGTVFGKATAAIAELGIPGAGIVAPGLGAFASKVISDKVFGRLGKVASDETAKTLGHVSKFLGAAGEVAKVAPPSATKVFSSVRFKPETPAKAPAPDAPAPTAKGGELATLFHERAHEIRSLVQPDPATGKTVMRPEARQQVAAILAPIGVVHPLLADQLETLAAKKITFLYDKLPKRPDIAGIQFGPDTWEPNDMQMRKWARYMSGVEHPEGIEQRLAAGHVSVEDAEVMKEVYPHRLAELTRMVLEHSSDLQKNLPLQKRIALTVLTGVPVVAAMDPRMLAVLQAPFANENNTNGGTMAPRAQPQFGSVSKPVPTPAQERAVG